jgi:dimethylargininase
MTTAITRGVPASFANALATVPPFPPIDIARAIADHAAYCAALEAMGARVTLLEPDETCPDCVFVEDTAVIAAGVALITVPGAPSRRAESAAVAVALAADLEVVHMALPATLDGGDCMRVGNTIFVGRSTRTNAAGIARLSEVFAPRGLRVIPLDLPAGVLHLKCVCSPLGDDRIALAEGSIPAGSFGGVPIVTIPAVETYAANVVAIGEHVLVASEYPRTHEVLTRAGFTLHAVPTTEVRKADGSLTCQSIVF